MKTWMIDPYAPLIFRDARPFAATPGARAHSLAFPFPSTTTGALRTQVGLDAQGSFDKARIEEVRRIAVRGPLLVELDEQGEIQNWLLPAPLDALLLKDEGTPQQALRKRLVPGHFPTAITNLPPDLAPLVMLRFEAAKPHAEPPRYWYWPEYERWLAQPGDDTVVLNQLGHQGPTREERLHVSLDANTRTAQDGALFATSGMEFRRATVPSSMASVRELALALATESELPTDFAPLGGERRPVRWRASRVPWPACPSSLTEQIARHKACRLSLLTPAAFDRGFRPTWLEEPRAGVQPTLVAAAVQRPHTVSGWDFAARGGRGAPKPTRRLAPAGSTYFLSLAGTAQAIAEWVEQVWMSNVSDQEQDRLDGFGLAVLGTWKGTLEEMQS